MARGFRVSEMNDSSPNPPRLEDVQARLRRFADQRAWAQFHNTKNLAMAIASEAGELLSELRWVSSADADSLADRPEVREKLELEVADIAIALLHFCERARIDLLAAIDRKIDINEQNYPIGASKGRSERPSL
jgi:NTP pyrophosphatase (non-canonical NTP hydrolase)